MVYGDLKYISIQMYIPLAISLKKKNFVALESALSPLSSQVLGFGNLKPLGQADWVEPPVVKYSVVPTAAAGTPYCAARRLLMIRAGRELAD